MVAVLSRVQARLCGIRYFNTTFKTAFHDRVCMIHRSYQTIALFYISFIRPI